jgi:hypothetical protein
MDQFQEWLTWMQAAAAKMGDPLRDMVSSASKRLQDYLDNYKHVKPKGPDDDEDVSEQETEWAQWQKVFAEVEECESLSTVLQVCQLFFRSCCVIHQ